MDFGAIIKQVKDEAKEAGLPVEKYMDAIAVRQKRSESEHELRSASDHDKSQIKAYLATLDGKAVDLEPRDVLEAAGVRRVQGTMAFTRHALKRLTDQRASTATAEAA